DDEIIAFATNCSELATEAAYLDDQGTGVFCEYTYGKTPIDKIMEIFADKKLVYVSARVLRLMISAFKKNG